MEDLKDYMLLFRAAPGNQQPTPQQLTAMKQQWGVFINNIAAAAKLVSVSRLGFEGNVINSSLTVTNGASIANNETLSGSMVVKAATLSAATEMARDCPILAMGGTVEVRVIIPMEP